MKWFTYMCSQKHEDTPFEATKDGKVFWWTIAVELPSYPYVEWATVLTLSEARQHWLDEGYALPDPPEVM